MESAGIAAQFGTPATPPTVDAARRLGLDLTAHESAPLDVESIVAADLVIGLERRHVQEVVLAVPAAFAKIFTLKELARAGAPSVRGRKATGQRVVGGGARGRRPTDLLGMSVDDDVPDPTGSKAIDHRTTAEEIDELASEVLDLLF